MWWIDEDDELICDMVDQRMALSLISSRDQCHRSWVQGFLNEVVQEGLIKISKPQCGFPVSFILVANWSKLAWSWNQKKLFYFFTGNHMVR